MTLAAAARIVDGHVPPAHGDVAFSRVTTDSRTIRARDLFVALEGDAFEGHDFVTAALDAGASAAMVHQPRDTFVDRPCIAVRDTKLALGQLARTWRARFTLPLIGVAGSNGKTTVTQMIASILRAYQGKAAFHTEGNFNNDIGLPLTVLRLDDTHRIGVVELGMNHPGEIAYLSGIARPTICVVTNAQREHQEFMKTVRDAAIENASMFDFLPANGMAIVNADDAHHSLFVDRAGGRAVMSFGMEQPADVRAIVDQVYATQSRWRESDFGRMFATLQQRQQVRAEFTPATFLMLKPGKLLRVRQLPVPDEPRNFLEAALLGQLLHRIAVIDQRVDLRHHLRDARRVHDHAFEAAMDVGWLDAHVWRVSSPCL